MTACAVAAPQRRASDEYGARGPEGAASASSSGGDGQPESRGYRRRGATPGADSDSTARTTTGTGATSIAATQSTSQSVPSTGGFVDGSSDTMSIARQIDQQFERIASDLRVLSAGTNACGDVCRAAADICTAATEICELTGDGLRTSPVTPPCARARVACDDARHQRVAACPVCPPTN